MPLAKNWSLAAEYFLTITQGKTMMKNFPFPFVIISELLSKKLAE